MRKPCSQCGHEFGRIEERGAQDCVFCSGCGKFQYNAPRVETGKAVRSVRTVHNISPSQRARILVVRANGRCEICGASDKELHVGHLLSVDAGLKMGLTEAELNDDENLASMCAQCNLGIGRNPVPLRLVLGIQMARMRRQAKKAGMDR